MTACPHCGYDVPPPPGESWVGLWYRLVIADDLSLQRKCLRCGKLTNYFEQEES